MEAPAARDLALELLSHGPLAYPDTVVYQLFVVKCEVLFQSLIGYVATPGGFLHRDVAVPAQQFHRPGIPLTALRARAARQVVAQAQTPAHLLAPFDHPRIVRTQLLAEVRAAQPKLPGDLRDVAVDVVHAVARRYRLAVFGPVAGR